MLRADPLSACSPTATNLCFAERNVYTSEVLAVVMQQLMEQSPLPMLLMRTVIQSLTMYPRLGGFVMNILARLIMKQVTRKWFSMGGEGGGTHALCSWPPADRTCSSREVGNWVLTLPD